MTREETKDSLHLIAEMYDHFKVTSTKVDIWHRLLHDIDAKRLNNAIAAYIRTDTKGYAPVPGQLLDLIAEQQTSFPNEAEAWESANKAMRNGLYGYEEEFEKLPPIVQKCIGSAQQLHNMSMLPSSEVQTVIRSQFIKNYRTEVERAKQDSKIPQPILEVLRKNNLLEAK